MFRKRVVYIAAALALTFGGSGIAQQVAVAPTPVPNAAPSLSGLTYFSGTWTCNQTLRGKARPDTSTTTLALDGRWLHSHDVAPPFDKYRTSPVVTESYLSYNQKMHRYVSISVDSFTGYDFATSPGWEGNTFAWTDRATDTGDMGVQTITKVSASSYRWNSTGRHANGKAVTPQNGTCTKS